MISRRSFLGLAVAATGLRPLRRAFAAEEPARSLSLYNTHTGEYLDEEYCRCGVYDREALARIDRFLRCHHTNEVKPIDVAVLDLLCDVRRTVGAGKRVEIISGYRSPAYNERLRRQGRGVVPNSLHLKGLALDFAIRGVDHGQVARVARLLKGGGVGLYSRFVHIDSGRVRYW